MMRTALARRTPLRSKSALRRSRPVKPVNRKRKTKRYARDFGDEADLVRAMPCLITGTTPSEPAHVTSRGAGGGCFDLVPLSPAMHRQQHEVGIESFQACHGLDLRAEADRIALDHPEPLGIRGLARRWANEPTSLTDRQRAALFGWTLRRIALEKTESHERIVCSVSDDLRLHVADGCALVTAAEGWPS
jgi:hypothetical protein